MTERLDKFPRGKKIVKLQRTNQCDHHQSHCQVPGLDALAGWSVDLRGWPTVVQHMPGPWSLVSAQCRVSGLCLDRGGIIVDRSRNAGDVRAVDSSARGIKST